MEGLQAKAQPSIATPTEDTCPKVLIRGEWRKVPDGYPADASGQLERDQLFINDLVWCTNGGVYKNAFILAPSQCLGGL